MAKKKKKKKIEYFDYGLLAVLICLICFGLVMLYSSSAYSALVKFNDSRYYFKRQIFFCVIGFAAMFLTSRFDYHRYVKLARIGFYLSIFMLLLVQTPLGIDVNGAKRWIRLPFNMSFQPSELVKIAVILYIPVLIIEMGKEARRLKGSIQLFAWGAFPAGCVYLLTDNLSTAIIILGITCFLIFVQHPKTAPFIGILTAAAFGIGIFLFFVAGTMTTSSSFRLRRIIAWIHPEEYATSESYQTLQSLYAIGSGGFLGKGLGNSAQKMLIPEVQNDMILSVICEELGVLGAIVVLGLFGLLLYRLMFIARNAPDLYGSLVVTGIFAHIALQVMLNVAVVTNVFPNTGITLPFISYGGTSLILLLAEMGIAFRVSRSIPLENL